MQNYSYVGHIPFVEYGPHSHTTCMESDSDGLKRVIDSLSAMLRDAGIRLRTEAGTGASATFLLPEQNVKMEVVWKRLLNDAVLLSVDSPPQRRHHVQVFATRHLTQKSFALCVDRGLYALDTAGNGFLRLPGFSGTNGMWSRGSHGVLRYRVRRSRPRRRASFGHSCPNRAVNGRNRRWCSPPA